jgi:hypothetical protein
VILEARRTSGLGFWHTGWQMDGWLKVVSLHGASPAGSWEVPRAQGPVRSRGSGPGSAPLQDIWSLLCYKGIIVHEHMYIRGLYHKELFAKSFNLGFVHLVGLTEIGCWLLLPDDVRIARCWFTS